jgi:very-short-patch-repair endonuclease
VSTRQLKVLGYSRQAVAKSAKAGRLHRIHRGVYAVGHRRLTWHGRCMAALLASAPAVASHLSAAWLWGLLRNRPATLHLTAPSRRHSRAAWVVHFARLAPADRGTIEAIPVTALPRTLLDLAATVSPGRLERALERSEELRLFDLGPVEALLSRSTGHPGAGRLRRAIAGYRPEPAFLRSKFELRFLELVRAAGLPQPSMNRVVAGFELDAYWPAHRFAVELDVFATHGSRAAFERDRIRQEELKLAGVEMVRITDVRLAREPAATMRRLAALLAQRQGAGLQLGLAGGPEEPQR